MTYSYGETSKANQTKELLFTYRNNIVWDRITIEAQEFCLHKRIQQVKSEYLSFPTISLQLEQ